MPACPHRHVHIIMLWQAERVGLRVSHRGLGKRYLILSGVVTDQCMESAARDACDLGYLVTVATDACATMSRERHDWALRAITGYCRQRTTDELVRELGTRDA